VTLVPVPCQIPHPRGPGCGERTPGTVPGVGGKVPSEQMRCAPAAPASLPPVLPLRFLLEARGPGGLRASPGRDMAVRDPRPCPCLWLPCAVAILHLLPWLPAGFSSAASSFQLRARSSRRAAALLPSSAGCSAAGPGKGAEPRAEEPAALGLGLVYVGEPCGLVACVCAAPESKPGRGGRSISGENIYSRTNPRGAGVHPAAGEAAPHFAGGGAPLALCRVSVAAPCRRLPARAGARLPGGGCLPGRGGRPSG